MLRPGYSAAADPPLDSPVHTYARAPAFAHASLSPQGGFIAFLAQSAERQSVIVRRLADDRDLKSLELISQRERVRWCEWAGEQHLLCGTVAPIRARDRITEQTRLYVIDVHEARVRELNTRLIGPVRDQIVDFLGHRSTRVLVQYDDAGRGFPEAAELDVTSGALHRVQSAHPPIRRWIGDGSGNIGLGIGYQNGNGSVWLPDDRADGLWKKLIEKPIADVDMVAPLTLGALQGEIYVLKHHEGRTALFRLDERRPEAPSLLFAHPRYDVSGPVVQDPGSRALLAVQYLGERETQHTFDESETRRQAWLDERLPKRTNRVLGRTLDGHRQLVLSSSDVDPPSLYVYDVDAQRLALFGHQYPELETVQLAPMRPTSYRARDGQAIPAYLTIPAGGASGNLPAVLLPHGGPEARNVHGFDPLVQFLASRGYVVLQMNFRGSLGYGSHFAARGAGQWGGVIHNDITDGARWLVERQIADPTRICIVGLSFGGYAALLAATRETQWYSCAASYAGISDLLALSEYARRIQDDAIWEERLGSDRQALWQMSPMARVRTVEIPVLIVHGREDSVVPSTQSRRFARALRETQAIHRHVERADCDHEMTIESCRDAFFLELGNFLQTSLGDINRPSAIAGRLPSRSDR